MKIPSAVRRIYDEQKDLQQQLRQRVDDVLGPIARDRRWHYESRIKSELSVALKLETGRVRDPVQIEDFFACTIVVRNLSELRDAGTLVRERFTLQERRPKSDRRTHKAASDFPFDDLRLYVRLKEDARLPPSKLSTLTFEVQIKTFLQHAWSIATHDLVYKTNDVSWSKQRIAYQIKAMLEHAEISIQEADRLSATMSLAKQDKETIGLRGMIELLKEIWPDDQLPDDLRRLAENIASVVTMTGITHKRLREILKTEREGLGGRLPLDVPPYGFVVQCLLSHEENAMKKILCGRPTKNRVVIDTDLDLPSWIVAAGNVLWIK